MSEGLFSVRVADVENIPRLAWANGLEVSLPSAVLSALSDRDGAWVTVKPGDLPRGREMVDDVRLRKAFTLSSPASTNLPFSYQTVPLWARTLVGHVIGRLQRTRVRSWASYPRWPLDLSADFTADLCGVEPSPFAEGPVPVLLSHDIDTDEGLRNLVEHFLGIEESVGASSSNYIVPCAWRIDHGLLDEVAQRGHEIGIHGYDHSNRTPFTDPIERRKRIDAARPLIERYHIIGYRAPSLLRTFALLEDLGSLYRYDSSIPTSGGLFPVPNNGCASARPFRIGELTEIPISLPRDGSLRFLGHRPQEILKIWQQCAERIAASGGVVSLLTHCEARFCGNGPMLEIYKQFLHYLATDSRYAFATPAQVLKRSLTSAGS